MEHKKRFCLLLAIYLGVAFLCRAYLTAFDFLLNSSEEQVTIEVEQTQKEKPNCLIFMHIPKSGGSSLKVLLENITRTERYSLEGVYSKTVRSPHLLEVNNTFIMGHFTTAIFELRHEFLKCYKVTIIREPIRKSYFRIFLSWASNS